MAVLQAESGRKLDEDDGALVLGWRAALALDNARLFADAEAARKQAEAANLAKDEFLAMLGHELRNPLAPISTALQPMARRGPDVAVQERRMTGRQTVHSAGEGRGATFTGRLPPSGSAPPPVPQPTPAPADEHRGSGRILVVDDNADAAQTLAELLQVIGYEARTAPDADAALQVLREFRPQLALLDIGLPQVDGYQLAGLIRQQPEGQGLTLVALTGYGQESDRARALAARFDEHLVKPVGIDRLTEVLQRFLQ